jgi:hypothetical protein
MEGLFMKKLGRGVATISSQEVRLSPLYHQSALRVIRATRIKKVLASH